MRNNVRKLRKELDISQEKLATAIGVSRHTIIGIEKGKQEPSGALVIKISNFFNKDPREIFLLIV
ncbi:helix-turn-helix transcriptional regulator [Tepidibacillus marianensis]|uniref:helix-turn-helix transcriptional regulator n=1 Tax=Tepidibacillus marianensis TaxID=3131995 RepID=UPI0030D5E5B1